jgi:hypothetical protein
MQVVERKKSALISKQHIRHYTPFDSYGEEVL